MEAVAIAGFTEAEAGRLFGVPDPGVIRDLSIRLRPPADVRAEFVDRHRNLLAACLIA
jgi:uncharacterized protein